MLCFKHTLNQDTYKSQGFLTTANLKYSSAIDGGMSKLSNNM